jgi:Fe-S cluster biogenesis protein NfuA/nitrite reductase/ring-hydroxylating ferredoxin subunit
MAELQISDERAARDRITRIEQLLEQLESAGDVPLAAQSSEAIALVVELYGDGLARIVARVESEQPQLARDLADDELVCQLMLLHGLHPRALEQRVRDALAEVRPYLESHGGGVDLVQVSDTSVRLRLRGSCSGCPSSTMTLKLAVEDAIRKAAPEIEQIEAEGTPAPQAPGLLELGISDAVRGAAPPSSGWAVAGGLPQLNGGGKLVQRVAGEELLFVRLQEDLYAYRPRCALCGCSLADAQLQRELLICADCQAAYDVRHAGRCVSDSEIQLEPVPLLVDPDGLVKVATGAPAR